MISLTIRTHERTQFIDITYKVAEVVKASGINDGIATVFVPHTTAGVTVNENADPDVVRDILSTLNRIVPQHGSYLHIEGNSDAHIKAGIMGFSLQVIIDGGRLALGTWQGIYFCEFDGPRTRKVWIKLSKAE